MMIGMSRVRWSLRSCLAKLTPVALGRIQSSSTRSGNTLTNGRHGLGYVGRTHHFMSGTLEVNRDQLLSYQLVFDYKYCAAHDLNGPLE